MTSSYKILPISAVFAVLGGCEFNDRPKKSEENPAIVRTEPKKPLLVRSNFFTEEGALNVAAALDWYEATNKAYVWWIDTDFNKKLSQGEVRSVARGYEEASRKPSITEEERNLLLDLAAGLTNYSLSMNDQEIPQPLPGRFRRFDINRDSEISIEEAAEMLKEMVGLESERDKNGKLTPGAIRAMIHTYRNFPNDPSMTFTERIFPGQVADNLFLHYRKNYGNYDPR